MAQTQTNQAAAAVEPGVPAPTEPATPTAAVRPPARRRRRQPTIADMVRSLAVILVPVLVITFFFTRTPKPTPQAIDYTPVLQQARAQAGYPVLAPVHLPDGWTATRAGWIAQGDQYGPKSWQLGLIAPKPDQLYFEIRQVAGNSPALVGRVLTDARPEGTSSLTFGAHRQTWSRYVDGDGRTHALVLRTSTDTAVVTADVGYDGLEAFVTSLSTTGP